MGIWGISHLIFTYQSMYDRIDWAPFRRLIHVITDIDSQVAVL